MAAEDFERLVYGSNNQRPRRNNTPRRDNTSDDMNDLGRTAVNGLVTVAEVGVLGAVVGGVLGAVQK